MKDIDYGISNVIFGNDEVESKVVKFGDGNTLIGGVSWGADGVGVCLVRNKSEQHSPFAPYKKGELNSHINQAPTDEKVYLLFDKTESIDALIAQLNSEKESLIKARAE